MFHLLLAIIYLSFISLGLPDALLGAAWPSMYGQFQVPVSYAGIISMIIAVGTIISSLQSDRLTHAFGPGKVTAASVALTAAALFGFSISGSFWALCLWAIPYGLGAGSVDASLNNYVALHYTSRHMSWLHCMWGLGASVGPYIMGFALTGGYEWNSGYRIIAFLQVILTVVLFCSLPVWSIHSAPDDPEDKTGTDSRKLPSSPALDASPALDISPTLSLPQILRITGAKEVMVTFFCYCALEQTAGLWASSYLVLHHGLDAETAAGYAGMFFVGITIGRAISGFITMMLNDTQMVRLGQGIILAGSALLFLSPEETIALIGLILIGLGCAPIYPCIIHSTPEHFGADKSQALIGVQMASAYVGTCLMPPLFGLIANHISIRLFPGYLLGLLLMMFLMHERMVKLSTGGRYMD